MAARRRWLGSPPSPPRAVLALGGVLALGAVLARLSVSWSAVSRGEGGAVLVVGS